MTEDIDSTTKSGDGKGSKRPERRHVLYFIAVIADTSWRMFVPTLGLLVLGLWYDQGHNTMPVATISGIIVGSVLAGLLVRQQLKRGAPKGLHIERSLDDKTGKSHDKS